MEIFVASFIVLLLLALVIGALSGKVTVTSCCATSDPARDLRMRAAFEDEQTTAE